MRPCLAVAAILCASAASSSAAPEMVLRERCHQGECTFTKIIQTKTIGKNDDGYMLEVKTRSSTQHYKPGARESEQPLPENYGIVRVVYMYCSTKKPALIFSDKKFYAHLLNIGGTPAGYAIDSHIEYWAACHDKAVSVSDVMEGKLAKDAAALGYPEFTPQQESQRRFRTKAEAFRYFGL
jgi:hypothetical protein